MLAELRAEQERQGAFAEAYADQNERDYQALADAVKSGRIAAKSGL